MPRAATDHCEQLVNEAAAQGACLFTADAKDRRQLNRMVKRGVLVRPHTALFVDAALWSQLDPNQKSLMMIRGLAKQHPDWVFCDMSAALVHGLWVSYKDARVIHICGPRSWNKEGIVCHKMNVDSIEVDGVRVTTLERTVFDCCRLHPVRASLGVADAALRITENDNEWMHAAFARFSHRNKGWHVADYVASIANGLSKNGGESLARATMIMLGFETPRLQVELRNPIDPDSSYRVDFLWDLPDGTQVAGELYKLADKALYRVKSEGRHGMAFHGEDAIIPFGDDGSSKCAGS